MEMPYGMHACNHFKATGVTNRADMCDTPVAVQYYFVPLALPLRKVNIQHTAATLIGIIVPYSSLQDTVQYYS